MLALMCWELEGTEVIAGETSRTDGRCKVLWSGVHCDASGTMGLVLWVISTDLYL